MAEPLRKSPPAGSQRRGAATGNGAGRPGRQHERRGKTLAADKFHSMRRRDRVRWILFALLPLVLIIGAIWYVTGGKVMSTDDAYVERREGRYLDRRVGHRAEGRRQG